MKQRLIVNTILMEITLGPKVTINQVMTKKGVCLFFLEDL